MKMVAIFVAVSLAAILAACDGKPRTYAASCSSPLSNWRTEKDGIGHLNVVTPVYVGSDGSVLWNKVAVSDTQLRNYMVELSGLNPVPQVVLEVSPSVSCDRVVAIRAIMDATPACNAQYSHCSEGWNWKEWPMTGGP
jgi:hypothetical protein